MKYIKLFYKVLYKVELYILKEVYSYFRRFHQIYISLQRINISTYSISPLIDPRENKNGGSVMEVKVRRL